MSNRRTFMGQCVKGAAGFAVSGLVSSRRILGAGDRVRFGLIGCGSRGKEIFKSAIRCTNAEAVAAADVYTRRLDEVKALAPQIKTYRDVRQLLDDKSVDAVLIATPQHQHALNFVASIQAGKDVYQEKTMAFSPDHARRMRKALDGSGRVVQVGIQMISGPGMKMVRELATPERMGVITAIHTHHYRNAPYGGWMRDIPSDCDSTHVDWNAFQGEATPSPFDPQRYVNWRFFWDYSGGNVFENMVHQVGYWHAALGLTIPKAVTMTGANCLSPKMQPPDVMDVTMDHQSEKILFTWNSMFSNNYFGEGHDLLLGTKGTIVHDETDKPRYLPQGAKSTDGAEGRTETAGDYSDATDAHMQNFIDCVRSRKEPNCPFEIGFRSAIACQMAVRSYREGRTVKWDETLQNIT
jgi:predicted dehydrogenase